MVQAFNAHTTSGDNCLTEDEMDKQVYQLLGSSDCDAMLSISQTKVGRMHCISFKSGELDFFAWV